MFYLVGFPRYDKMAMIIFKKSESYKEVYDDMPHHRDKNPYSNMAILSDIYPVAHNNFAVTQQDWEFSNAKR